MKTSDNGINLIKSFEGLLLESKQDVGGVWTIGYGHTSGVKSGMKITESQAVEFLKSDLANAEKSVNNLLTYYNFNQNEFDALVSFTFNCGSGNLLKLTNNHRRNKGEIADKILLYNKAGGQVLKGLVRRRQAERDLFCSTSTTTPPQESSKKSTEEIAREVIKGLWGNGAERKKRLTDAGYNYSTIQKKVNQLLKK